VGGLIRRAALVATTCAVFLICGIVSQPDRAAAGEQRAQRPATAVAADRSSQSVECRPPSLANCYTEAGMLDYIKEVQPMVVQFFRSSYRSMPEPNRYLYIPETGPYPRSACQDGSGKHLQDAETYAYCSVDENIYLGQSSMWALYHESGDAAPAIGLAHEWGHNVQNHTGVPAPTSSSESVNYENQADCVAGAWIRYAIQQGWFEQEDIGSTERFLAFIADAEEISHGNLQDRTASLSLGISSGLSACNSFYPDTPIYT
jgi:predicted metalloprotease